jgi:hypothetical protein
MVIATLPRVASTAHHRWVLSCMAATSSRGASGFLHRSELRFLLICANASVSLSPTAMNEALESTKRSLLGLPAWLRIAGSQRRNKVLDARQLTGFLVRLCTSSGAIADLFNTYAVDLDGRMNLTEWLGFVCSEQLARLKDRDAAAQYSLYVEQDEIVLAAAREHFDLARRAGRLRETGFDRLHFQFELLSQRNLAEASDHDPAESQYLNEPLAMYWMACSHK